MTAVDIPRSALRQIQAKAKQYFGLSVASGRLSELYRKLIWLAKQQHIEEVDQWLQQLAAEPWSDTMREQVIPAFTIGETYFRRDPNATEWLRQQFLPKLINTRARQGAMRIDCWSAGCCTGEEPYGLLFLLDELKPAAMQINIIATDLNKGFLHKAKSGRYRQGSFRSPAPDFQQRYFSHDGDDWVVLPKWRHLIQFEMLNLVHFKPPRAQQEFDLILCRNVLMYFSQEDACKIIRMYVQCLRDGGVLLLGAVDAGLATAAGFDGFWAGDNYALTGKLRAPLDVAAALPESRPTPAVRPLSQQTIDALAQKSRSPKNSPLQARNAQPTTTPAPVKPEPESALHQQLENPQLSRDEKADICIQLALHLQQKNRSEESYNWLTEAASVQPLNERAHILLGQYYLFSQRYPLASEALQRALYLNPNHIAGNFYFGQAKSHLQQQKTAIKAFQTCLQQLASQPDDALIEDTGGLSVAHLTKLCEQLIHSGVTYAD